MMFVILFFHLACSFVNRGIHAKIRIEKKQLVEELFDV